MRLGIVVIPTPVAGGPSTAARAREIARRAETLGFADIWATDALGRGFPTVDPLQLLATLAGETATIELGTCVLQLPLRHPVELAHRVASLDLLSDRRLRLGIGAGSTEADFLALDADYAGRFRALPQSLETMRRTWRGEPIYGPALSPWRGGEDGPPILLGAWRNRRWIDMAARDCRGWIASGIFTTWEDLATGLAIFRAAGGERGVLANIFTDFRATPVTTPLIERTRINLVCTPAMAGERLKRLEGLGLDDALLVCPFDRPEQLEQARELLPA